VRGREKREHARKRESVKKRKSERERDGEGERQRYSFVRLSHHIYERSIKETRGYVNRNTATHCNTLQPTATYCQKLQPTATHTHQIFLSYICKKETRNKDP